jgi:hypothetical protein
MERGGGGLDLADPGMTLRDYFAAHFMARAQSLCETNNGWEMHNAAQCAYQMADAMLEARKAADGEQGAKQ